MIKPAKCPRCGITAAFWYYQDFDERGMIAVQHRCNGEGEWLEIFTRTMLGAILRWNLWAWRERRKMRKESGE